MHENIFKPIYKEIFYRSERKGLKNWLFYPRMFFLLSLNFLAIESEMLYYAAICSCEDKINHLSIATGSFVITLVYALYLILKTHLPYVEIYTDRLVVVGLSLTGKRKVSTSISPQRIEKVVINGKRKRIEIHLKDGKKIFLRKSVSEIRYNYLSYDQFKRFKKAMDTIGAKYEIIYP